MCKDRKSFDKDIVIKRRNVENIKIRSACLRYKRLYTMLQDVVFF